MDPEGIVIPMLMPGATDACQYQKAGIKDVWVHTRDTATRDGDLEMAHGHDERMPISFIEIGTASIMGRGE